MLEYSARITSQEPVTDVLRADINKALSDAESTKQLTTSLQQNLTSANKYLKNAFVHINNLATKMVKGRQYVITSSGYVSSRVAKGCPYIDMESDALMDKCETPREMPPLRLTLRSDYDALKRQVDSLSARLAQLEATTKVTPITNCDLRKDGYSKPYGGDIIATLKPQYGDWLLTSDAKDQGISFSGLRAEIGRSIYIQTRRRAYLYTNNHSFYGLPGSSTRESQWLSNNTTYRFVRASDTSWLVTSSPSPYPWT